MGNPFKTSSSPRVAPQQPSSYAPPASGWVEPRTASVTRGGTGASSMYHGGDPVAGWGADTTRTWATIIGQSCAASGGGGVSVAAQHLKAASAVSPSSGARQQRVANMAHRYDGEHAIELEHDGTAERGGGGGAARAPNPHHPPVHNWRRQTTAAAGSRRYYQGQGVEPGEGSTWERTELIKAQQEVEQYDEDRAREQARIEAEVSDRSLARPS